MFAKLRTRRNTLLITCIIGIVIVAYLVPGALRRSRQLQADITARRTILASGAAALVYMQSGDGSPPQNWLDIMRSGTVAISNDNHVIDPVTNEILGKIDPVIQSGVRFQFPLTTDEFVLVRNEVSRRDGKEIEPFVVISGEKGGELSESATRTIVRQWWSIMKKDSNK